MQTTRKNNPMVNNLVQAVIAYHGSLRGYDLMTECYQDESVLAEGRGVLAEIDQVYRTESENSSESSEERVAEMFRQIVETGQTDRVNQHAADPRSKLARENQLMDAWLCCVRTNTSAGYILRGIAAALHTNQPDDEGAAFVQKLIQQKGIKEAVVELCSMTGDEEALVLQIVKTYHRLALELEWQEKARQAYELGFENERVYKGCGQSVFAAVGDVLGIYDETTFRAATGLSGGLGLIGDAHCSALTGTCLIAGILYPRRREFFNGDRESKYQCYDIVQKMHQHYLDQYGSVKCYEIHRNLMGRPFDLRDDVDKVEFEKAGAHEFACTGVVGRAARWVVELVAEKKIEEELVKIAVS